MAPPPRPVSSSRDRDRGRGCHYCQNTAPDIVEIVRRSMVVVVGGGKSPHGDSPPDGPGCLYRDYPCCCVGCGYFFHFHSHRRCHPYD